MGGRNMYRGEKSSLFYSVFILRDIDDNIRACWISLCASTGDAARKCEDKIRGIYRGSSTQSSGVSCFLAVCIFCFDGGQFIRFPCISHLDQPNHERIRQRCLAEETEQI